jgi:hypothetical protein
LIVLIRDQVESTIALLETSIETRFPEIRRMFVEAQSWRAHQANGRREQETGGND